MQLTMQRTNPEKIARARIAGDTADVIDRSRLKIDG